LPDFVFDDDRAGQSVSFKNRNCDGLAICFDDCCKDEECWVGLGKCREDSKDFRSYNLALNDIDRLAFGRVL